MFLTNLTLRLFRRVRRNDISEAREPVDIGVLVDHLNLPCGDSSHEELAMDPDADDRVCGHESKVATAVDSCSACGSAVCCADRANCCTCGHPGLERAGV